MNKDKPRPDFDDIDTPPLSKRELAEMRPASEVVPGIVARYRGQRGKQKAPTKQMVSMRLDPVVIAYFKKEGPGWQTRVNDVLMKVVTRRKRAPKRPARMPVRSKRA